MKKLAALLLAGLMGVACVACSNNDNNKDDNKENNKQEVSITDANEILTTVWDKFEDEDSDGDMYNDKFAVIGGHFENPVDMAPGKYDVSKAEDLEFNLCVPQDAIAKIDDAASMIHMMNANTFTAGAFHVKEAADVTAFVDEVKERLIQCCIGKGIMNYDYMIPIIKEKCPNAILVFEGLKSQDMQFSYDYIKYKLQGD
jgi:hypothetical protein